MASLAGLVAAIEDFVTRITNVHWGGLQQAVAGIYGISPAGPDTTLISKDGETWGNGFGDNTGAAATGFGRTVVGRGRKLVAFGKPRDGESCFIAISYGGNNIERGVLDVDDNTDGELTWTVVGSVDYAYSCVFAGGAFFISYYKEKGTGLAISFDGVIFTKGIEPFKGVENASICNPDDDRTPNPNSEGGCVAYDKETQRYVTTGKYLRSYDYTFTNELDAIFTGSAIDQNFMSSVSSDGILWSPYFDQSEGDGLNNRETLNANSMEQRSYSPSSVCFGKGLFVAAASQKVAVDRVVTSPGGFVLTPTYTPAASVATSTNGASWTCRRLPETLSELDPFFLVNGGDTQAVAFIKTAGTTEDGLYPQGFFVALGSEFTNLYPDTGYNWQTKFWVSDDGLSWTRERTDNQKFAWILSAISKSAKPGSDTIIYI